MIFLLILPALAILLVLFSRSKNIKGKIIVLLLIFLYILFEYLLVKYSDSLYVFFLSLVNFIEDNIKNFPSILDNIYFIVPLLIILMLSDYFLTLKYTKLAKEVLTKHVEIEEYELNPNFQKNIREGRYNFRHLFGIIFLSIILTFLYYLRLPFLFHFIEGIILGDFVIIDAFHIGRILELRYLKKNPSLLIGKMKHDYLYSLVKAKYHTIGLLTFIFLLVILVPSTFLLGVLTSQLLALLTLKDWRRKYLRKHKQALNLK
ncbi:MAG: hypothetical protein AB1465_06840 [Patescibacteria group bacterium]